MIEPSSPIRTGLVKPNRRMLSAICRICFLEWVRALPGWGRRPTTGMGSIAIGWGVALVRGDCGVMDIEASFLARIDAYCHIEGCQHSRRTKRGGIV